MRQGNTKQYGKKLPDNETRNYLLHYNEFIHERHYHKLYTMTLFLYYILNRRRNHSGYFNVDCGDSSILRFSEIFRDSSHDRTAHEKRKTAVWCAKHITIIIILPNNAVGNYQTVRRGNTKQCCKKLPDSEARKYQTMQ